MDLTRSKYTHNRVGRALLLAALMIVAGCATHGDVTPVGDERTAWNDDAFALSTQADRAYREGRWIDAVRDYEALTRQVPQDPYSWFRLGNTYARQGEYERAIPAFEASLARNSAQPKPWFNLSSMYLLTARQAMYRARDTLRAGDPAQELIDRRISLLDTLIHDRFEDVSLIGTNRVAR